MFDWDQLDKDFMHLALHCLPWDYHSHSWLWPRIASEDGKMKNSMNHMNQARILVGHCNSLESISPGLSIFLFLIKDSVITLFVDCGPRLSLKFFRLECELLYKNEWSNIQSFVKSNQSKNILAWTIAKIFRDLDEENLYLWKIDSVIPSECETVNINKIWETRTAASFI